MAPSLIIGKPVVEASKRDKGPVARPLSLLFGFVLVQLFQSGHQSVNTLG